MWSGHGYIELAAYETREFFEHPIDKAGRQLLMELYIAYNPSVGDASLFVDAAIESFPVGTCGLASLYNRHLLGLGDVRYRGYKVDSQRVGHTVLELANSLVISDVTADQFDGPPVYIGRRRNPWVL